MNAAELLKDCQVKGVVLSVKGGALRFSAPRGTMTPKLLDTLTVHKATLLVLLSRELPGTTVQGTDARDTAITTTVFGPDDWDTGEPCGADVPVGARIVYSPDGSHWTWVGAPAPGWFRRDLVPPPFGNR
jgi:hypothetical protein